MMPRDPKSLNGNDIVMSNFTLDRHAGFPERIRYASDAGLEAMGIYLGTYAQWRKDGHSAAELRDLLDESNMCLAEIEVVAGWAGDEAAQARCREMETFVWEIADEFGCRYLQAIGPYTGTIADAGKKFARLCDEAADHGLIVGIEFLPFTNIVDAADARAIAEAADRPNGGICVDIWHHQRGANDLDLIASLPGELVKGIQVSDGTLVPEHDDYYTDCLTNRRAPGDGDFDKVGFIRTLDSIGADVPWGMEVCNAAGWATPEGWVNRCADGWRAALAAARC